MVRVASPRVVYAAFATPRHSGGVHVLGQHVRLLRGAGFDAVTWFPDEAPAWFTTEFPDVPPVGGATLDLGADELLVLPEVPIAPGHDPAPGARVAILNQNHFYTYATGSTAADTERPYPGWRRAPVVWVVSRESRDVLSALHPHLDVVLVPNHVDPEAFAPATTTRRAVAWFPRKRPHEAALLRRLLAQDPRLAGVDLLELVDAPRSEVVETLGRADVFVALGHSESFGLPVAEALAAGCLVVGYDGGGGYELFEAPGAWAVPEQRPLLLRDRVADLVQRADELAGLGAANRVWVTERYGRDRTAVALTAAATAALAGPGAAATATHPAATLDALPPAFTAYG